MGNREPYDTVPDNDTNRSRVVPGHRDGDAKIIRTDVTDRDLTGQKLEAAGSDLNREVDAFLDEIGHELPKLGN